MLKVGKFQAYQDKLVQLGEERYLTRDTIKLLRDLVISAAARTKTSEAKRI